MLHATVVPIPWTSQNKMKDRARKSIIWWSSKWYGPTLRRQTLGLAELSVGQPGSCPPRATQFFWATIWSPGLQLLRSSTSNLVAYSDADWVGTLGVPPRVTLSFWATIWSPSLWSARKRCLVPVLRLNIEQSLMLWLNYHGTGNYSRSFISVPVIPMWCFVITLAQLSLNYLLAAGCFL
jgi:hypothetical protein